MILRAIGLLSAADAHHDGIYQDTQGVMQAEACPDDSCHIASSFLQVDLPTIFDELGSYESSREADHEAAFLPSVDCVRVIGLEGSSMRQPMESQLREFGLWNRTFWQTEKQDLGGSKAGCWRAHVKAVGRQ